MKRIGIFYLKGDVQIQPSVWNMALLLARNNFIVDLYVTQQLIYSTVNPEYPGITIYPFSSKADSHRTRISQLAYNSKYKFVTQFLKQKKLLKYFFDYFNFLQLNRILAAKNYFKPILLKNHNKFPYALLIGVEPDGLIVSDSIAMMVKTDLVYLSLELWFYSELPGIFDKLIKKKEQKCLTHTKLTMIQDKERSIHFCQENNYPCEKIVILPNSPLGEAERNKKYLWHEKFGLSIEKKIVLYSGTINIWNGLEPIISSISSWPENWVLIIHSPNINQLDKYIKELIRLSDPHKVFFSFEKMNFSDYSSYICSADIGIALYFPYDQSPVSQTNNRLMGLSSGKIADYLHAGLPIIMNNYCTTCAIIENEKIGVCIHNPEEISTAIERIDDNYSTYCKNAVDFFNQHLTLESKFPSIIDRLIEQ